MRKNRSDGFSLIKANGISKPATVLIQKISDAISGYFKPYQIRRVAKADTDAEIIKAQARIKINRLQRRALIRFVNEEAKKQENMEAITEKAVAQLTDSSTPQDMDDDWITNFFDKCRIISDKEMHLLWAKVLAGEANSPGTFSKRTVNSLGSLDKLDAQLFTKLCGFVLLVNEDSVPFIYDVQASIYNDHEIIYTALCHLDDIGLISFGSIAGFTLTKLSKQITIKYYGTTLILEFKNPEDNELEFGNVMLTHIGEELSRVCGAKPVDAFLDFLIERWSKKGLVLVSPYPKQ